LAQAIKQLLPTRQENNAPAVASLRQKFSISKIFDEHLIHYRLLLHIRSH
jgi:hypothetical protein